MRSKSPRTSGLPIKSSPSANSRSKSVPNSINQTPTKSPKSPSLIRNNKNESPLQGNFSSNSKIEPIFDFFINEINSKQFFPTQRKKELLDLARASKQNGNRYTLSHKKSQIISTQFWKTWNSFQSQLEQELLKQLTQNQHSVSRNLTSLSESVNSIKGSKKITDLQDKTNEIVEKGNNLPDNIEGISSLINEFKQFQTDIVRNESVSKQQTLKYKFTSTISQILTLLKSIKDIMLCQIKVEGQFESSFSILEAEIPQNIKEKEEINQGSFSFRKTTPTPTKTNIKSKIRPSPSSKSISSSKSTPIKYKSDIDSDDFENELDINNKRQIPNEAGNKKEKGQVSYSNDLKNSKNAAIEAKKGSFMQSINEKSKLQSQFQRSLISESSKNNNNKNTNENLKNNSEINQKNGTLSYSIFKNNRKPVQFDSQFDSIADLYAQKRFLTYENYKLNAICESYLRRISGSNQDSDLSMGDLYKQNYELRKERFKYDEQLFDIKIDILHANQILQRATLRPSLLLPSAPDNISFTSDDINQLRKDYISTFQANNDARSEMNSMKEKYEEFERNYIRLMKQKCESTELNEKNLGNILDDLKKIKIEYRAQMTKLLLNQTKAQNDAIQKLKIKTNKSILRLKTKADNDILAIETQQPSSNQSNEQINQIKKNLQKNQQKITKNEINELTEINHSLLKWISQIKTQSVDLATNMQSLIIQYEIMQKKAANNEYDVNSAFKEEIRKARERNQSLKELLETSFQELSQIDIGLGGSEDNISVEQRLQSIISKIAI